ncbi:DUF1553 domain-containing protein [Bremerella cremea]|uniref:DUF1553 domain-containing protein n=1 Tax=Bremerella cremea TaxID=1031537 RepID=A0A368KWW7_9BACT|nr:PSD1 and planctomycete cytochrome C domain-containing protein [Bremerella cremea]RCS54928.1 DUF1553 domain-containing protein [Bremerella cremea]
MFYLSVAKRSLLLVCAGLVALALVETVRAQDESEPTVKFNRDVKQILAKKCFSCHGPAEQEGSLRLDERETAIAEADSGEIAIVPGKPEESELIRRIQAHDESERMPPEGEGVSPEDIETLKTWIREGAKYQGHWAFEPLTDPQPPEVKQKDWVKNDIDNFILERLEENGLQPNPRASKRTLIRRAYYNLTGLPPTKEEIEAFEADDSPDAWGKLVDKMLASEHYGEKWGRHWLDLVRFAETNSYERDGVKPNAWKYRDYVIRSFNENKPYDQFIVEQLAGDEIEKPTPESIIATGYYRLGVWDDEPADPLLHVYDQYDDLIATTGKTFLGITVNCARCHDHKIDPITQANYYEFLSFFRGMKPYGTRGDVSYSQREISSPEVISAHENYQRESQAVENRLNEIVAGAIEKLPEEERKEVRKERNPERRREKMDGRIADLVPNDASEYDALKREWAGIKDREKYLPAREFAMAINRSDKVPDETNIMMRGNPHVPGEVVEPGFPQFFNAAKPIIPTPAEDQETSGRRLVLAKWIASKDNLMTARVMVNRIWQFQFGRGIVRTSSNFGQLGTPPTHPELLDWLANEFIDSGWDVKHLQRLMMTSATYQMSSAGQEKGLAEDPGNDLMWRFNSRRLTSEEVRDSILAVNGRLNEKMFGHGFYPKISDEVMAGQSKPGDGWGNSSYEEQARRAVYIHVKRSLLTPILSAFDFPETDSACEERFVTTQPAQALGMMNGAFANQQAEELAKRVRDAGATELEDQVRQAVQFALAREANESDVKIAVSLVNDLKQDHGLDDKQAFDLYCLMLINLNEFFFLD